MSDLGLLEGVDGLRGRVARLVSGATERAVASGEVFGAEGADTEGTVESAADVKRPLVSTWIIVGGLSSSVLDDTKAAWVKRLAR
jgi:hypothetical protein